MTISRSNLMSSSYHKEKLPIHDNVKRISFSAMSLNYLYGIQGALILLASVISIPASAQIVTTKTGINVNTATSATAISPGSIALGSAASSSGLNAISIGTGTTAIGDRSVAIGPQFGAETTSAVGNRSVALGSGARAGDDFATAFGANSIASGNRSVAIGINSSASAESAIAIGQNSLASQLRATALGSAAVATGIRSTAIGNNAQATEQNASAFGFAAHGYGFHSTAIGANSEASGESSTSLGTQSFATGPFSTAIGAQSQAIAPFSTAIGAQAIATQPNQIAIGTNTSRVTIPSLGQDGSFLGTTNQNGTTRLTTTDAEGNLGTSNISVNQVERIPAIESSMYKIGSAMNAGTSIALALSAVPTVSEDPRESIRCGIGTGGYGGTYAVGLGCAAKVFNRLQINGGLSFAPPVDYGYGTTPKVGGRIGFSFPLGVSSQSSLSSAPSSVSTTSGTSDSNTRIVIEQLRNDLDQQKQITLKLQQQLQALMAKTKS